MMQAEGEGMSKSGCRSFQQDSGMDYVKGNGASSYETFIEDYSFHSERTQGTGGVSLKLELAS